MMNTSEFTILRHTYNDIFGKYILERGYNGLLLFKHQDSFVFRTGRRIWNKLHLPFESMWYDKRILEGTDKIIVFEPLCTVTYMKWLRKVKPNADIVFWYWNIAKNTICPDSIDDNICRKYSFARMDCLKYGMKFNPLPYFKEIEIERSQKEYDIVFVGKDKGRLPELLKLKHQFESMGLITKFVISPDHPYDKNAEYSKPISYIESVKLGCSAKAVLDYIEVNNSGQSLRVIEALFQKSKIITNSILVSDYDFYCPDNIFILGKDDLNLLPSFLNTPYREVDQAIVDNYDFDNVVNRFFSGDDPYGTRMVEKLIRGMEYKKHD